MKIIPGILVKTESEFKSVLNHLENKFKLLQIDICDGTFTENETFRDENIIYSLTKEINLELHLMVKKPLEHLKIWERILNFKGACIHFESVDVLESLEWLNNRNLESILTVNPETKISEIKHLIPHTQTIMFMSVIPGKQGQSFIYETLARIKEFKQEFPHLKVEIDGGVNETNFEEIKKTGVQKIIIGSYLLKDNIDIQLAKLNI